MSGGRHREPLREERAGALTVDLFAPGMTPLHRVGAAGLAMTLQWLATDPDAEDVRSKGSWQVSERRVEMTWDGDGRAFFTALIKASFRLTSHGLVWFPALGDPLQNFATSALLHSALVGTFLQHGKSRKAAASGPTSQTFEEDDQPYLIRYLALASYAHQTVGVDPQRPLKVAGWLYPGGAVRHNLASADTSLTEKPARALALLYAPVATIYFQVHRRAPGVKPGYCLVFPEVVDLVSYALVRRRFLRQGVAQTHVAGPAEAALRVVAELAAAYGDLRRFAGPGCTAIAFGAVPWSPRQKSRIDRFPVAGVRSEGLIAYRTATGVLRPRLVTGSPDPKTGDVQQWWSVPQVPDLVARNAADGVPWWRGFAQLWERVRQGLARGQREWALHDEQGGLHTMVTDSRTMPPGPEARLVGACHEAWRRRLGALGERSRREGLDFGALARREYERVRVSLARCKNAAMVRQTLTDLWARAGALPDLQEAWPDILPLLSARWQDARDLALLALASYKPRDEQEAQALAAVAVVGEKESP